MDNLFSRPLSCHLREFIVYNTESMPFHDFEIF
jgi:hypothetical protein